MDEQPYMKKISGKRVLTWLFLLCVANLLYADVPNSHQICLQTDKTSLLLEANSAWTIVNLMYDGYTITDALACGSAQGTVIWSDGAWIGSAHGGETILSLQLIIDEQECNISPGKTFKGSNFYFKKKSSLGGIVNLTAEVWFDSDKITEKHHYVVLEDGHAIGVFYAFLNSHNDAMIDWCMQDANENIYSGRVSYDVNQPFIGEQRAVKVSQYDPNNHKGIAIVFESDCGTLGESFIWNRTCDNKLYFRYFPGEGYTNAGSQLWACQTRHFFECDPNEYQTIAFGFKPKDTYRYKSDLNNNGVVDFLDLVVFANEWLRQQPWYIPFIFSNP
jgi:hypothetical protein